MIKKGYKNSYLFTWIQFMFLIYSLYDTFQKISWSMVYQKQIAQFDLPMQRDSYESRFGRCSDLRCSSNGSTSVSGNGKSPKQSLQRAEPIFSSLLVESSKAMLSKNCQIGWALSPGSGRSGLSSLSLMQLLYKSSWCFFRWRMRRVVDPIDRRKTWKKDLSLKGQLCYHWNLIFFFIFSIKKLICYHLLTLMY